MPLFPKRRKILLREPKQSHGRPEPFAVFRMGWMLELFLQMDECASRLNEPFKILRVLGRGRIMEPDLFEHVVRFIIPLLVPTAEKSPVIRVRRDPVPSWRSFAPFQGFNEPRNPLA